MIWRMFSVPASWPVSRSAPCERAQRLLPSMMMATCRGMPSLARVPSSGFGMLGRSDLQDFGFLRLRDAVDFVNEVICHFLQALLQFVLLIFRYFVRPLAFAQRLVRVAANIPDGDP